MDALRLQARRLRNAPTDAERHLWYHLRRRELAGHRFRRQVPVGLRLLIELIRELRPIGL